MHPNRRDLLLAGACAASTALFWSVAARLRAEGSNPPPETTTIRLVKGPSICLAPQYVVSDLLNAEGFTNVVYLDTSYVEPGSGCGAKENIWERSRLQLGILWSTSS